MVKIKHFDQQMAFVVKCHLLFLLVVWISPVKIECSVPGLPAVEALETLVLDYQDNLSLQYSQDRVFPSLRFNFTGRIIGWAFAATDNEGGGRPRIGVWGRDDPASDQYSINTTVSRAFLDECIVDQIELDNNVSVFLHQSGPEPPGLDFNAGDILGLFMQRAEIADYVPYLYNASLESDIGVEPVGGFFSYYLERGVPRDRSISLGSAEFDQLLPLLSLKLCSLEELNITGVPVCNGTTELTSDCGLPPETTEAPLTTLPTLPITTAGPAGLSNQLLGVVVAVPVILLVLLLVTVVVLILVGCLAARKRKHSTYTTDIAVEAFQNGSPSSPISHHYKDPTYRSSADYDTVDPTFIISVTSEKLGAEKGASTSGAGNYEEPMVLRSGSNGIQPGSFSHQMYSTPVHSREPSSDQSPSSQSPLTPSALSPPDSRGLTFEGSKVSYHASLDKPGISATPPSPRRNRPLPSPASSPHHQRIRLRSAENLVFGRTSSGANPNKESPLADRFFRLETGAYVPTEDQRNHLVMESLFDDTAYATFNNKVPNTPRAHNWEFFEESESYWKPAADARALLSQLSSQKYREINRKQIEIKDHLGSGEFGTVCRGEWHTEQGDLDIAVKMLNHQATEKEKVRFLQEAAIVGQFKHPNIVRLHGVVTMGEPVMIVLELVQNGDLRKYLRTLRPAPGELPPQELPQKMLDFCSEIALGMEYLSRKEFVHRDLAARNILLTEDYICKIADFGMSRDLSDDDYYISHGGKIPIKWSAPEALQYRRYSTASDVWSFGVLMYEVWSLGKTPFKDRTPEMTITLVQSGYRMSPPPGCPRAIYEIMIECWHSEAHCRPSFTKLLQSLAQPTTTLLGWSLEDSNTHPQASVLGGPLEASADLYHDLQNKYMYASADLPSND